MAQQAAAIAEAKAEQLAAEMPRLKEELKAAEEGNLLSCASSKVACREAPLRGSCHLTKL